MTPIFIILADILCDFEIDKCKWSIKTQGVVFQWVRKNGNQLTADAINGPFADYDGKEDKFFMIASRGEDSGGANEITSIISPEFKVNEHVLECFGFWFQMGVVGVSAIICNETLIIFLDMISLL